MVRFQPPGRFPYDRQELEVLIRAPANMARDEYLLVPKATVDPALMELQAKSAANDPNDPGKVYSSKRTLLPRSPLGHGVGRV